MPRVSGKENKNVYQLRREELGLTREKASELLESIPPERIEKIENEKSMLHPDEVLIMAEKYKAPELCNYFCANQCPIGKKCMIEVKISQLSQIVLEMISSINTLNKSEERLVEISVDGKIDNSELDDFISIQRNLDQISMAADALKLWSEKMLANGSIDADEYNKRISEYVEN